MRVYLPATSTTLRALLADEQIGAAPITAFAVTPGLREWYVDDDVEELEYAAMSEAARASLRLIDADDSAAPRRCVLAVDVDDADVSVRDDLDRGVVRLNRSVPWSRVASVHMDEADAEGAVRAAAAAITAADLGDGDAEAVVDDAEGYELLWFATQEVGPLLELM